jgi:hypothetical protein
MVGEGEREEMTATQVWGGGNIIISPPHVVLRIMISEHKLVLDNLN